MTGRGLAVEKKKRSREPHVNFSRGALMKRAVWLLHACLCQACVHCVVSSLAQMYRAVASTSCFGCLVEETCYCATNVKQAAETCYFARTVKQEARASFDQAILGHGKKRRIPLPIGKLGHSLNPFAPLLVVAVGNLVGIGVPSSVRHGSER